MNLAVPDAAEIPLRGQVKAPFCCIGNEVFDVFLPVMEGDCFTLYAYLVRRVFHDSKLKHSVRELAAATAIGITTVARSLEVLEHLRLVKLIRFGGSKNSECQLIDSWELAMRLGAKYNSKTLSYSLPPDVADRLKAEVKRLREQQQKKPPPIAASGASQDCGNPSLRVSQRDDSVSLARHQRSTRETQTGTYLLTEERRIEEVLSPTPSHERDVERPKGSPNEGETAALLKWATDRFNGVIDDMRSHLLDIGKPPNPRLVNGYADWRRFGFDSLAVEAATMHGDVLALELSATDPAAARLGLEKYHRKWNASLCKWFGNDVEVKLGLVPTKQRECPAQKGGVTDGSRIRESAQGNQSLP